MASKVYWKGLELTLHTTKRYIQRWDTQLHSSLTSDQYTCLQSVLAAIVACLNLLPTNTPEV
jgi:hypothetical protein